MLARSFWITDWSIIQISTAIFGVAVVDAQAYWKSLAMDIDLPLALHLAAACSLISALSRLS